MDNSQWSIEERRRHPATPGVVAELEALLAALERREAMVDG